jgi:glycosyltransferase involved in cell wall biosynthesis
LKSRGAKMSPKSAQNRVTVVIPALNEEESLRHLLPELQGQQVIVVDNGSSDATAQVAEAAGAQVIHEPQRGYGRACWRGFQTALVQGAEIVVFLDGDGSDNPADLPQMLAPVLTGRAELAMGSRVSKLAEPGAVPPQARLGNWLVSRLLRLRYGVQIHDIGSFRVVGASTLASLQMQEMTFGWPVEMLLKAARAGYRIEEVNLRSRRRTAGSSKVARTLRGSLKAAYCMLRTTLRYASTRRQHA